MTKYDHEAHVAWLLAQVLDLRAQVLRFVRELDGVGVVPGFLPGGAVESLAEADAALGRLEERLEAGEAPSAEINDAERHLEDVRAHIRELQQEIWKAAVKQRPR